MTTEIRTHRDVLKMFPSMAHLARELGMKPSAVLMWSQRDKIPPGRWDDVCRAAEKWHIRVTPADLLEIIRRRRWETPSPSP